MSYAQEATPTKLSGMKPRGKIASKRSIRDQTAMTSALNHPLLTILLQPLNETFTSKKFELAEKAKVRIGRQTNPKTAPTETNGFFDSKVLSRTHAEVWCERGKPYIKDLKSSNGTFVNRRRLSPEGAESEPEELHHEDILEFGIDIVGDDNQTVVYQKVAARVVISELNPDGRGTSKSQDPISKRGTPKNGSIIDMINSTLEFELQNTRDESSRLTQMRKSVKEFGVNLEEKNVQVKSEEIADLKRKLKEAENSRENTIYKPFQSSGDSEKKILMKKLAEVESRLVAQKQELQERFTNKDLELQKMQIVVEEAKSSNKIYSNEVASLTLKIENMKSLHGIELQKYRVENENISELSAKLPKTEKRCKECSGRYTNLELTGKQLEENRGTKPADDYNRDGIILVMSSEVEETRTKIQFLEKRLEETLLELELNRTELEKARKNMIDTKSELDVAGSRLEKMQSELVENGSNSDDCSTKASTESGLTKMEIGKMSNDLAESKAKKDPYYKEKKALQRENEELTNQIAKLQLSIERQVNERVRSLTEQFSQNTETWGQHKKQISDPVKDSEWINSPGTMSRSASSSEDSQDYMIRGGIDLEAEHYCQTSSFLSSVTKSSITGKGKLSKQNLSETGEKESIFPKIWFSFIPLSLSFWISFSLMGSTPSPSSSYIHETIPTATIRRIGYVGGYSYHKDQAFFMIEINKVSIFFFLLNTAVCSHGVFTQCGSSGYRTVRVI
ncbi:hypothetical protein G9A89_008873 [Geosiphon pyriformis]|nr:hypothetical protein G9A89_008873 [Geosiphon pyriformis]